MKKILLSICVLVLESLNIQAQTINRYIPDGWEWKNASLNYGVVIKSTSTAEIAIVPPYYYANWAGEKVWGSAVVTELEGYKPYNSGWMVKSLDVEFDEQTDVMSPNSVPSNIIPNINAPTYAAFYNCTNMKKIVLPPTIKKIGSLAFENCALNELVCMAVTPPTLANDAFDKVTIGKIIVPKGTLQIYKATAGWNNFNIEEGAETYSDNQMVEDNGAWYEVVNGEASLVNSDGLTDYIMPETLTCLIKGEWKTVPVTSIREWSVGGNITLNDKITDIPQNYADRGRDVAFYVKDTHPTLKQLTKQVIANKNGNVVYYVFGMATVPHGVTAIANNALNHCTTEVYLPTTLVSLGVQSTSAKMYFTSPKPPVSTSRYGGYVPQEYLETYNNAGYGSFYKWNIPAGYECLRGNNYTAYWHPQKNTYILKNYTVSVDDVDADGVITLPSQLYVSESMNGSIETYDLYILDKNNDVNNLHKIRVPEGVKTISSIIPIHNNIYQSEYNIQEINLPSTLERCKGLSEIEGLVAIDINPNNKILDSRDNCNAVIETATNTLLTSCSTTIIPSSVEHIADSAFYMVRYTQDVLSIPASVKSIGKHAFRYISRKDYTPLQIEFSPSSQLTCIEDSAFYNSSISRITLPESVEYIKNHAFAHCENLKEVILGNKVKEIGERAFYCNGLTSIKLPDALETIGDDAFYNMPTLEAVTFGKSLKKIGSHAFYNCVALTSITIPEGATTSIGNYAFSECRSLTNITLPKGVTNIGSHVFEGTAWYDNQPDGLVYVGNIAYKYKGTMPDNTTVELKKGTVGIACEAFRGCDALTSIIIPEGVVNINDYAFWGCSGLTGITIPEGVVSIGNSAFIYCIHLESVTIPSSVTGIGSEAFDACSGIRSIYSDITDPTSITGSNFYESTYRYAILYVPEGSKKLYESTEGWNRFEYISERTTNIVAIEEEKCVSFDSGLFSKLVNSSTDLRKLVVDNMFINLDNVSATDSKGCFNSYTKSIDIYKATSDEEMEKTVAGGISSNTFNDNFAGIILQINGMGSVKINTQTVGNNKLAVKMGDAEAKTFVQTEKGDVTVNYDVTENTYVYIYATDANNQQQSLSMDVTDTASDNAVKVYSVTVTPNVTAIENVASVLPATTFGKIYSIDGKQISQPQKGLNIVKMSDGTIRKIMK